MRQGLYREALIETASTGEVILVMTQDAPAVMQQIKDGLAAG